MFSGQHYLEQLVGRLRGDCAAQARTLDPYGSDALRSASCDQTFGTGYTIGLCSAQSVLQQMPYETTFGW